MGQLLSAYLSTNHLHVALKNDSTWLAIRMLVLCGYDVNTRDKFGRTPLHIAISHHKPEEVIKLLADNGTDINAVDNSMLTPLHLAIQQGSSFDIIEYLIESGANLQAVELEGNTPLHFAAIYGCPHTLEIIDHLLLEHDNVNQMNTYGETVLHLGLKNGLDLVLIQFLLLKGADPGIQNVWGSSCLHYCVIYCTKSEFFIDILSVLSRQKACDVNLQDQAGETALHVATRNNLSHIVIDTLLQYGADPSIKNNLGCTPLHYIQSVPVMDMLFLYEELINVQDKRCATVLHHIFRNKKVSVSIVKRALTYGCDPNIRDFQQKTALHVAMQNPTTSENLFLTTKYLLNCLYNVNGQDYMGDTVLHMAVRGNVAIDVLRLLLNAGANVDIQNKQKVTPLEEFHYLLDIDYTKLLLLLPGSKNVNVIDKSTGFSFLHRYIREIDKNKCTLYLSKSSLPTFYNLLESNLDVNLITANKLGLVSALTEAFDVALRTPGEASICLVQMLYEYGANPHFTVNRFNQTATEEFFDRFLENNRKVNDQLLITVRECIFASLRAGLNMHEIGNDFILSVIKHFAIRDDWDAVRRMFKYGITINHLSISDSDKRLMLQIVCKNHTDLYPLPLFELAANVVRVLLRPNCYLGAAKLQNIFKENHFSDSFERLITCADFKVNTNVINWQRYI